jgi:hypothetical protein
MHRGLTILVTSFGIGLLGADAPPAAVGSQSVTILNSSVASGDLEPLQTAYVSAKVAASLDAAGVSIARLNTGVRNLEKEGSVVCAGVSTALILVPTIRSSSTGGVQEALGEYSSVRIELATYDCLSHAIKRVTSAVNSSFDWTGATTRSIADVVKRYLSGAPSAR